MNKKVYFLSAALVLITGLFLFLRLSYGGQNIRQEFDRRLWRVQAGLTVQGKGTHAKVRLTLPKENERQTIYNENFDNASMSFSVRELPATKSRIGIWQSEILDGTKALKYTFSAQLKSLTFTLPPDLQLPAYGKENFPPEFRVWLDPSEFIQSKDKNIRRHLKRILGRKKNVSAVMRLLYDFVRGQFKYRTEKKSKDAREALKELTANCGGQARVMAALSRAAGIPSRLVGGLILQPGVKQITHVWVENYIGGQWIPFDTVNDYYAAIPKHYLELYHGDLALIRHSGLAKIDYYFDINDETIPPVDQPWSLYVIPAHFHNMTKTLLLIPIGALLVALFRLIIGIPTFGTFGPILLAIAFQDVSLGPGLLFVTIVLLINWLVRRLLDSLKILIIPKLAILVTMVVIVLLSIMMVSVYLDQKKMLYVSVFPIIIMTWMTERFSVLQIEDGTVAAFKSSLGTMLVAVAAYYVMEMRVLRSALFAFPELLFLNIAFLLLLGRYTGIRLTELWRFRDLNKLQNADLKK